MRRQLCDLAAIIVTLAFGLLAQQTNAKESTAETAKQWVTKATVDLDRLRVSLSQPVLVHSRKDFLWFPTLLRMNDGRLLAIMSDYADVTTNVSTARASWSTDGGLSWGPLAKIGYSDSHITRSDGTQVLLPYYLFPRDEGVIGAACQTIAAESSEIVKFKPGVRVSNWPRAQRSFDKKLGLAGFVFNGGTVALKDGGYLAALYGYFGDEKRYSLVAAESRDGLDWKVRSIVAGADCPVKGAEGPCESAFCRLRDGRIMCAFRLSGALPLGQCWSSDEGRTWTPAVEMAGPFSVQPSLAVLKDGTVALSSGRPGLYVWFNVDGTGKSWQRVDLASHHNWFRSADPIEGSSTQTPGVADDYTSSYTETVVLDDKHLLCIYDRIPPGWNAKPLPTEASLPNSVWVVRLTVEKM